MHSREAKKQSIEVIRSMLILVSTLKEVYSDLEELGGTNTHPNQALSALRRDVQPWEHHLCLLESLNNREDVAKRYDFYGSHPSLLVGLEALIKEELALGRDTHSLRHHCDPWEAWDSH